MALIWLLLEPLEFCISAFVLMANFSKKHLHSEKKTTLKKARFVFHVKIVFSLIMNIPSELRVAL